VPNILLVLEYDGSEFNGWQTQIPGSRTIQQEMQRAIETVLSEKISTVQASGRTDSGVHARAQVVNFQCAKTPDLHKLSYQVSCILRGEVSVVRGFVVPDSFNAQESALRKCYRYTILCRAVPPVLDKGKVWHLHCPLDRALMQQEAAVLEGTHDFASFRGADCSAKTSLRTIFKSSLSVSGDYLTYEVVGDGFLKQMVRIIVGTLVDRGRGRLELPVTQILKKHDRHFAGVTAPAQGLCLEWVEYPPEIMHLLQSSEKFPQS
jgi:tRNA pseudouridine38-40 synthase